jgi:hypothetical protein
MANPLTSTPKKLTALIQCVTRTVIECCEVSKLSGTATASRGMCAAEAVVIAEIVSQQSTENIAGDFTAHARYIL